MRPADFRLPRHVKGGWEIAGYTFEENPAFTVPRWATMLVETWLRTLAMRGAGPMGRGPAINLRSGGYLDQPALAMEAFALFDSWVEDSQSDET